MSRARHVLIRSRAATFCFLLLTVLSCDLADAPRKVTVKKPAGPAPAAGPAEPERSTAAGEEPGFLGVLLARESVDVAAEAAGRLTAVAVRAGDVVW
jgi:multidrug efflux pump subunit AcrA (membrane-fusion protein)